MQKLFISDQIKKYDYNSRLLIEKRKKQRDHSNLQIEVNTILNQFNFIKSIRTEKERTQQNLNQTQQIKFMSCEPNLTINHQQTIKSPYRSRIDKFYRKFPQQIILTPPLIINTKILSVKDKHRSISVRRRFQTTQEKSSFQGNNNDYLKQLSRTGCIKQTKKLHTFGSWSRKSSDNIKETIIMK